MLMNNLNSIEGITFNRMRRMHLRNLNDCAVSEVISYILVFVISTSVIVMILLWGTAAMEENKANVHLESSLFQLDAMVDLIEDVFNEGAFDVGLESVRSSKAMGFVMSSGLVYLDEQSERFVLYYSVLPLDITEDRFDFEVRGFDPDDGDEKSFIFSFSSAPANPLDLRFTFTHLNGGGTDTGDYDSCNKDADIGVECNSFDLSDAVRIDIERKIAANIYEDYGRIWLFDTGSLNFETTSSSGVRRAIVENGGVLASAYGNPWYFYNEPKYWNQSLLDGSNMIVLRMHQIKIDPDGPSSISPGSSEINFFLKPNSNVLRESKQDIFSSFKMRIYVDDDAAFSAWKNYYLSRMNFEHFLDEEGNKLMIRYDRDNDFMFSLIHSICYIDMEVQG